MEPHRLRPELVVEGIAFGESPRWRRNSVWYCDWVDGEVISVTPDGGDRIVHARLDGFPVCIDWDADDRLLVVDGARRRVLRESGEGLEVLADLASVSDAPWNEIVTHRSGRVYVNGVGFDMMVGEEPATGQIAVIEQDGSVREVGSDLAFPNGMVITADGARLIVAESHAARITSFAIAPDGGLFDRATLAEFPGSAPDGLCLAADGSIWYADVPNQHCRHITPDGDIIETIDVDRGCFSCVLSPADDLYITANIWDENTFKSRRGVLYRVPPVRSDRTAQGSAPRRSTAADSITKRNVE